MEDKVDDALFWVSCEMPVQLSRVERSVPAKTKCRKFKYLDRIFGEIKFEDM